MKFTTAIVLIFIVSIPFTMLAQEEAKEKKVRIKTVKVIDGEKVVTDTTYVMNDDDNFKEIIGELEIDSDDKDGMIEVFMDMDIDEESGEKIIVINEDGEKQIKVIRGQGGANSFTYDMDIDVDKDCKHGNKMVMVSPHSGNKKVMKWKSDDGEEYVLDLDTDHEFIMKDFEAELENLEEMHIEMEDLQDMENLVFIEKMKALEDLEDIEDMDIRIIRAPKYPDHPNVFFTHPHSSGSVSDDELREAGIKNKPDRLAVDEMEIEIDNGVVDLSFSLETDGTPKLIVYNYFGDKVFTGKPELMNEKYQVKMDLSTKQHGTYYLQIIQKNSSLTEKLKL